MEKSQKVKLIPFEKIIQLMDTSCKTYEVKRSESQIYDALVTAFPAAMIQDKKYVAYDDVVLFMDNWIKALKTKDFNFLTQKRGMRCEPVDIEEFIDSKDYLNQATQIRPAIKREILKIYAPGAYFPEVILTGATGIGKDYITYLMIARALYELWCFYNPQVEFGLAAGTSIVMVIQSKNKELARKVTFDELVGTILRPSKFFQEKYNWDKTVSTELRFPNNVFLRALSGDDTSALGMAVFLAACFPGQQEYLCADGTYSPFGDTKTERIITSDGYKAYTESSLVESVLTYKEASIVRMYMEGGSYIDCTPNQRFKDVHNRWIEAQNCKHEELLTYVPGVNKEIFCASCVNVEHLKIKCPVYDIQSVPKTHTVIVPTKDKTFHLLAHNCNEMNFMDIITKSKKAGNSGNQEYNQAARIYRTLSRRIKGRFNYHGKVPGKMILISSAKEEGDFIHKRLQDLEAISKEERDKVYVMNMSQWASLEGLDKTMSETFLVEKGDDTKQSRIIKSRDEAIEEADVIEIPMDYYGDFEQDIDGSLADIAGEFVVGGRKKFIPYKEDILRAATTHDESTGGLQLFLKDTIVFDRVVDPYKPDYSLIVNHEYLTNILSPNAEYALHIDYGFTGDATGIAVSHVSSFKLIQSAKVYDPITNGYKHITNTSLPVFFVDGILQVYASSGSEVDIDFVEGLVYYLKEYLNIKWVTFDSYESRSSIQGFKKRGMISGVVSTVSNLEPYTELKNAIKTQRIIYPNSSILLKELRELERTPQGKIDHTPTSTKDVSDALAATLHILMRKTSAIRGRTNVTEAERQNIQKRELPTVQRRSRFSRL